MNNFNAPIEIRLMALELVIADALATIHRNTVDPAQSLMMKRAAFRWLMEDNRADIADSISSSFYPEELQAAVDQLFLLAQAVRKKV